MISRAFLCVAALGVLAFLANGCKSQETDQKENRVEGYIKLLKSDVSDERANAAKALGDMRATTNNAPDELKTALSDSTPKVQKAAADALVKIGTKESFQNLKDGVIDLKKANNPGAADVEKIYADGVDDLRDKAAKGEAGAKDTLEALGEPVDSSVEPDREHGVKVEIK